MEKVGYLKIFCRQGRTMIISSDELNELLADKSDKIMILPVLFDTDHVQIKEIDVEEFKNLLPNTIITSPYEPYIDNKKKTKFCLNSEPFSAKKLVDDAKKLISGFKMSKLFDL